MKSIWIDREKKVKKMRIVNRRNFLNMAKGGGAYLCADATSGFPIIILSYSLSYTDSKSIKFTPERKGEVLPPEHYI